eukprot:scpid70016/ scgid6334/ 
MEEANTARDLYKKCIDDAKQAAATDAGDNTLTYQHMTFDFAQQATIPHHAREVGALYFKVPRRIQIFGIAEECLPKQTNYLVDENQSIGPDGSKSHGPNAVVSMLHYHLSQHQKGKPELGLHCDNCCGQNKNRTVMAYLCWRTIVGLNDEIDLMFKRVGHTRCFVDGGFGFLKQKYRKSDVDTLDQLAAAVDASVGFNEAVQFTWDWRVWDGYMGEFFTAVSNITKYQRFRFSSAAPGDVLLSGSSTLPDKTINILQPGIDPDFFTTQHLPLPITPAGISLQRAKYLFQQ